MKGNTPLHIAALYGQELLLSVLLASGAAQSRWAQDVVSYHMHEEER